MSTRVQPITISGYQGHPTTGSVTIQEFNRDERWRRALVALAKWWSVALVSVFVPVAHFVLVPSFFLYGLWQGAKRIGTETVASDARGTCPDCGREQTFEVAMRWHTPQPVACRYCQRGLRVS